MKIREMIPVECGCGRDCSFDVATDGNEEFVKQCECGQELKLRAGPQAVGEVGPYMWFYFQYMQNDNGTAVLHERKWLQPLTPAS
jgi:hypothetical protein